MATEPPAEDAPPPSAAQLLRHAGAVHRDYVLRLRQWSAKRPAGEGEGEAASIDPKAFQAQQAALKAAMAHIELLMKLARALAPEGARGGACDDGESEAELVAEAERNLALPEP